jgi:tetratricopeptide (TPR) repeat protein
MRKWRFCVVAALCCAAAWPSGVAAQVPDKPEGHRHHGMKMPAGDKLGELSFPNSGNAAAQAPFLRGVKLLHNFQYEDAIAPFQQAQKADPDFALAYWGEAMAHNYTLWAEQHTDEARAALGKLGPTPEARAAKAKTSRERMWLGAVEALYGPGTKFERDEAYADRMDALFAAYPNDLEARVFDALATMGRSHGTRDTANYMKAAAMLEEVFPTHTHHPGVVHYMIHAYDDPVHAPLGIRAARLYDKIAPSSEHAQHMTSHIFLAMGMWPETEQANMDAAAIATRLMAERHMGVPGCGHEFIWLVYAKLQQGKAVEKNIEACRAEALTSLREAKDLPVVGYPEGNAGSYADMLVRTGIETGRWGQPLELPAGKMTYARFIQDYGRVLAAGHNAAAAATSFAALQADHAVLTDNFRKEFPDEDQVMPWLDLAVRQGEALVDLAQGRTDDGLRKLEMVAKAESALPPAFGPPILLKPSWELLGDERLAAGDKAGAAEAYRTSLALQPGRRLSLAGLKAATGTGTLASGSAKH